VRKNYQRNERKSNHKLEIVRGQELLVRVPLPMAEVWAEMQAQVEELTGQAGLQILRAILENEVTRRVGPPHRPNPTAGCVRWGKQSGYVVFRLGVGAVLRRKLATTNPIEPRERFYSTRLLAEIGQNIYTGCRRSGISCGFLVLLPETTKEIACNTAIRIHQLLKGSKYQVLQKILKSA
jgi:hypothetical protein